MKKYQVAVFIGRFQPYHRGHERILQHAAEIADNIIVLIGSVNKPRTINNPFTFEERCGFIPDHVNGVPVYKKPVRDFLYNDSDWIRGVQSLVEETIFDDFEEPLDINETNIAIVGYEKDGSSYYLKLFPQWDFSSPNEYIKLDATTLREQLFQHETEFTYGGVKAVNDFLNNVFKQSEAFVTLKQEFQFILDYKEKSRMVGFPYPTMFVTADAVVVSQGHVLMVKRKVFPGKGLWALPGGFVKESEFIRDAAVRELREETKIKICKFDLINSIKGERVFDAPGRSLRGRTITHAYFFYLNPQDRQLPQVKGADDAEVAKWIPLKDFYEMESQMFEDHWHIANSFINRI